MSPEIDAPEIVIIPLSDFKMHMKRVEFLVGLVRGVLAGMSQHPMGRMMMPPETVAALDEFLKE